VRCIVVISQLIFFQPAVCVAATAAGQPPAHYASEPNSYGEISSSSIVCTGAILVHASVLLFSCSRLNLNGRRSATDKSLVLLCLLLFDLADGHLGPDSPVFDYWTRCAVELNGVRADEPGFCHHGACRRFRRRRGSGGERGGVLCLAHLAATFAWAASSRLSGSTRVASTSTAHPSVSRLASVTI
jgi:hypothetical protein